MKRPAFWLSITLGGCVPLVALTMAIANAKIRHAVHSFVTPLSTKGVPSHAGGPQALPVSAAVDGSESTELRELRKAPTAARGTRDALLWTMPAASHFVRPSGLVRPDVATGNDVGIDRALSALTEVETTRAAFVRGLRQSGRYQAAVRATLRAWKVPDVLAAIIFLESGFSPTASASDGGAGLWSLPQGVAETYGLLVTKDYDERRGVVLSTEAAAHYLSDLFERFQSWELAVYAFGRGYALASDDLQKGVDAAELRDLRDLDAVYVDRVTALGFILLNPERFGFGDVHLDDPETTSDLEVPSNAPFGTIARAAGTSVDHLRELNPEYLTDVVPNTGLVMVVHLPSIGFARAKELLLPLLYSRAPTIQKGASFDWGTQRNDPGAGDAAAPPISARERHGRKFYRVEEGDTLASVAARFNVSVEKLVDDNALDRSSALRSGQLLVLSIQDNEEGPSPSSSQGNH